MNKKYFGKIAYLAYTEFVLILIFWIAVGLEIVKIEHIVVYAAVFMFTMCSVLMLFNVLMFEKIYMENINKSFTNLENLNFKLRSQRHEYLNEMQIVYGLLEIGEYEEALNYLKPVYADIARVNKALKTAKPAVNALLQAKMEIAVSKGIELFLEISSNLADIKMEQWDLCKVLGNITDNAITALSDTKNGQIHIQISENSQEYIFIIYNNGPVIPRDKLNLIFKRGYTTKTEAGHGLGLSLVKDIITENGGNINLTSNPGKTCFEITIPK